MGVTVVDAGVLIAVLDPDDVHHRASIGAVRIALEQGDLIVPASAYAEILVHPFRAGRGEADRVDAFLDELPAVIVVCDRAIARSAATLRATFGARMKLPDALVVATAMASRAHRVLTTDLSWPEMGVTVEVVG
jgi:predicted nucleic acid-binding protein